MIEAPKLKLPEASPCPALPWFSREKQLEMLAAGQQDLLADLYAEREEIIRLANQCPYRHGFGREWQHWQDALRLFHEKQLTYVSGGKRASKSELCAKTTVQSAVAYPNSMIWCGQGSIRLSIDQQQGYIWRYLPPEIQALSGKKSRRYNVNWRGKGVGFVMQQGYGLVLPNQSQIVFLTYNQDSTSYQGGKLGADRAMVTRKQAKLRQANLDDWQNRNPDRSLNELSEHERWWVEWHNVPPNVGAWMDESLSAAWLVGTESRLTDNGAKMLWSFSTIEGITAVVRDVTAGQKFLETKEAELLPGRVNVPGCPPGHMPYIAQPPQKNRGVIYFHTVWNPFSSYNEPGGMKDLAQGRSSEWIMENLYGYAKDTRARSLAKFSEVNIITADQLPKKGTRYSLTDPAGARNWFTLWVLVSGEDLYFYREWPDVPRYGEWAIPDDGQNPKVNGKLGPAQRNLGYGYRSYKQMLLREEAAPDGSTEEIFERLIDPRAGNDAKVAEKGGTSVIDELAKPSEVTLPDGTREEVPGMEFVPAAGKDEEFGLSHVNDLLDWDRDQPLTAHINAPRLWVVDTCLNTIWAMNQYDHSRATKTDQACKDPIDLLRYAATSDLVDMGGRRLGNVAGKRYGGVY
jgi:hypothetical protein